MEIRPVKDINKPKYPRKNEIDIEEVKNSVPKRWAASPAVKVALGTLAVVSLADCVPQATAGVPLPVTNILEPENKEAPNKAMAFKADFADSKHGIVIEFVSKEDVEKWSRETGPLAYKQYYTRDAAEQFQRRARAGRRFRRKLYRGCAVRPVRDPRISR